MYYKGQTDSLEKTKSRGQQGGLATLETRERMVGTREQMFGDLGVLQLGFGEPEPDMWAGVDDIDRTHRSGLSRMYG